MSPATDFDHFLIIVEETAMTQKFVREGYIVRDASELGNGGLIKDGAVAVFCECWDIPTWSLVIGRALLRESSVRVYEHGSDR